MVLPQGRSMTIIKNNIFLTGAPSSGKTTVIKKVIKSLNFPANGFYTEEERVAEKRIGFLMRTLDGKSDYLAHQDIKSRFHIRRYGVSIQNIENIAVPSIKPVMNSIIVVDEIGKMECFSEIFKEAALNALDSSNIVVGTITFGGDDFILGIKKRGDLEIIEVTPDNRDILPEAITERIASIMSWD